MMVGYKQKVAETLGHCVVTISNVNNFSYLSFNKAMQLRPREKNEKKTIMNYKPLQGFGCKRSHIFYDNTCF